MPTEITCECSEWGHCKRRDCTVPRAHWKKCQSGSVELLDQLYRQTSSRVESEPSKGAIHESQISSVGTKLAEIIKRETRREIECEACKNEVLRLNSLTQEQVLEEVESIADSVIARGKKLLGWWTPSRWAFGLAPSIVRGYVVAWIQEAVESGIAPVATGPNGLLPIAQHLHPMKPHHAGRIRLPAQIGSRQLTKSDFDLAKGEDKSISRAEILQKRAKWRDEGYALPDLVSKDASSKVISLTRFRTSGGLHARSWVNAFTQSCVFLGKPLVQLGCSCGGNQVVQIYACRCEAGPAQCCLTDREHSKIRDQNQVEVTGSCESCNLRNSRPRFITSAQYANDVSLLASAVPHDVTTIVGVSRSGLSAAAMIAMKLHLPLEILRQNQGDVVPAGSGWRLAEGAPAEDKSILVVDDTCMTGNSLRAIRPIMKSQFGNRKTYYACVYVNPLSTDKPDLWVSDLSWPHLLEWNLTNSVLLPSCAFDIDGVLCRDCPAENDDDGPRYRDYLTNAPPLLPVRRQRIPLIISERLDKYRDVTVKWLAKWRIEFDELVMGPWPTSAERTSASIARFKAEQFSRFLARDVSPGPHLMIESDPQIASAIAKSTNGIVVCPGEGRCYFGD